MYALVRSTFNLSTWFMSYSEKTFMKTYVHFVSMSFHETFNSSRKLQLAHTYELKYNLNLENGWYTQHRITEHLSVYGKYPLVTIETRVKSYEYISNSCGKELIFFQ